ncbi:TPA: hypothetical protein MCL05_005637 [Klebsiella pneumoniae]|nr:hypothetical protein [Klebsiella pneumoniae]
MLHLTTTKSEDILLQVSDILLIKSYGNDKATIYLKGVQDPVIVVASFTQIKFAINNNLSEITEPPLKLAPPPLNLVPSNLP